MPDRILLQRSCSFIAPLTAFLFRYVRCRRNGLGMYFLAAYRSFVMVSGKKLHSWVSHAFWLSLRALRIMKQANLFCLLGFSLVFCTPPEISFQEVTDYSSEARLDQFSFRREFNDHVPFNNRLQIDAEANIDHTERIIRVTLPQDPLDSGKLDISVLKASFKGSFFYAMVEGHIQLSGSTINNFNFPVIYNVFSENGLSKEYSVRVDTKVFEPAPPQAYSIKISGQPLATTVLTGTYHYSDANFDPEGDSVLNWLISDSQEGKFKLIPGEEGRRYNITSKDKDKFIKFQVVPVSRSGEQGDTYLSKAIGPILESSSDFISIEYLQQGDVLISEVLYNVDTTKGFEGGSAAPLCTEVNDEFIEVYNNTSVDIDLEGISIHYAGSSGAFSKIHTFQHYILPAGERLVLIAEDEGCYNSNSLSDRRVLFKRSVLGFSRNGGTYALIADRSSLPDPQPSFENGKIELKGLILLDAVGIETNAEFYEGIARAIQCSDRSSERISDPEDVPVDTNRNVHDWGCSNNFNGSPGAASQISSPEVYTISKNSKLLLKENGSMRDLFISLTSPPSSPVSITLFLPEPSKDDLRLNNDIIPVQIDFTSSNYAIPQFVSVSALNDTDYECLEKHYIEYRTNTSDKNYDSITTNSRITISRSDLDVANISSGLLIAGVGDQYENIDKNDYIVLYNPTETPVSLNGKFIGRDSGCTIDGGDWTEYVALPDVYIGSHRYYLISRVGNTLDADLTWEGSLGSNYCVVLADSFVKPTSNDHSSVIDFVSFQKDIGEGCVAAGSLEQENSFRRKGICYDQDTNVNANDFYSLTKDNEPPPNSKKPPCPLKGAINIPVNVMVAEGELARKVSISLFSAPSSDVHIALSVPEASISEFSLNSGMSQVVLTFTSSNFSIPQDVFIEASDDPLDEGKETHYLEYKISSSDPDYAQLMLKNMSIFISIKDNDTAPLVIAEVGNKHGNTTQNDYIVLYNPTENSVPLNGKFIGRDSGCTIDSGNWTEYVALPNVYIGSRGYYLISRVGNTLDADLTWEGSLSSNYCVVLANSSAKPAASDAGNVIDFVSFKEAIGEGGERAGVLADKRTFRRKGMCYGQDTNKNADDFDSLSDNETPPPNSNTTNCPNI